jgi:hypothetical protein
MGKYKYSNKRFIKDINVKNNKKFFGGGVFDRFKTSTTKPPNKDSSSLTGFSSSASSKLANIANSTSSKLANIANSASSKLANVANSESFKLKNSVNPSSLSGLANSTSSKLTTLANSASSSLNALGNEKNSTLKGVTNDKFSELTGKKKNINLLLAQKQKVINEKLASLNEQKSIITQRLKLRNYDKSNFITNNSTTSQSTSSINLANPTPPLNNHLGGIRTSTEMPKDLMGKIKYFFKSDFFYFMKYYLYFIVLFSICFYILMYINQNTKDKMIIVETKIFFYICVVFLFIIINDILESPLESLKKFFLIIIFSLITVYIVNYYVTKYYKKDDTFYGKLKIITLTTLSIYAITVLIIYFMFQWKNSKVGVELFNAFSFAINKNFIFLVLLTLYLCWYKNVFTSLNWNASLTDILQPAALGGMLILFIFIFIIYLCLKFKIINRINVLNSFIVLLAISFFLFLLCLNTFMSSLGAVCTTGVEENTTNEQEMMCLLIIAGIFIICWYDDVRNWHQIGSIIFIIVTLFTLYCMFYYSVKYPSTGLLSFWLFIEWLIIIFYRKQNSKNSLHFAFMKT